MKRMRRDKKDVSLKIVFTYKSSNNITTIKKQQFLNSNIVDEKGRGVIAQVLLVI